MESKNKKWQKNIIFQGVLELETGLHIGGIAEAIKIGGLDLPVIRGPVIISENNGKARLKYLPIIPGSSIKGKMRSLIDLAEGHIKDDGQTKTDCLKNGENCLICQLFGHPADKEIKSDAPSRLIVRDATPTPETIEFWEQMEEIIDGGEVKGENTINRVTSMANPRFIERVPAKSKFKIEFVLRIYKGDDEEKLINLLKRAVRMLEDDYLGGCGTRGYGKVKFNIDWSNPIIKTKEKYLNSDSL